MANPEYRITADRFDAVLFDLDGVLTGTAEVHAVCWKRMFDEFLRERARQDGDAFRPFEIETDYKLYVDGRPRYEGVRTFLESRGIELPYGAPDSPPDEDSVCGLGNRKSETFVEVVESEGVEVFAGSVALAEHLLRVGIRLAVVTSSKNCDAVLKAAGIGHLFELRLDGVAAARMKLAGKPSPDTFLKAAEMLGVDPKRAVVIEDAISGVQAGRSGGFGLVVGVAAPGAEARALRENGADVVVDDLRAMIA